MQVLQVLRSNEQFHVKQCHYAVLPRSNRVAISEMTHCINSALHAVDAAIVRAVCSMDLVSDANIKLNVEATEAIRRLPHAIL